MSRSVPCRLLTVPGGRWVYPGVYRVVYRGVHYPGTYQGVHYPGTILRNTPEESDAEGYPLV